MPSKNHSTSFTAHEIRDRELFNRIAYHYCRKDLLSAHRIARICRLEQTINVLPILPETSILEVGCGAGFSAKYLRGKYREYCGIDHSEELIKYANVYNSGKGVEFFNVNIMEFKTARRFDVVLLVGVLHHLNNLSLTMNHMIGLLRPGGWIIANEPHSGNPLIHYLREVRKRTDSKYSWDQFEFTIANLQKIFQDAKLEEIKIVPQGIFSTPFSETIMPFQKILTAISRCSCKVDRIIEKHFEPFLKHISWNVIAAGKKTTN